MKSKRADLREHTVQVFVAVFILVIIFGFAVNFYFSYSQNKEKESAKSIINVLEERIKSMPENSAVNKTIQGVNGENWVLTSFDFSNPNRPDACFEQPCIHICKAVSSSIEEDCKNNGVFRRLNYDEIEIINPIVVSVYSRGGGKQIMGYKEAYNIAIDLPKNLIEIQIEKRIENGKKILIITHYSEEYLANKHKLLSFGEGGKFGTSGGGSSF